MKFLFFALLISSQNLISQSKIPIPSDKSESYDDHKQYYPKWLKSIQNQNHIVFNQDSFSKAEITRAYWNRFNAYYKMMPDQASDIMFIFFDAIEYDKDAFCVDYKDVLQIKKFHGWAQSYYTEERFLMDRVCNSVFKTYNKTLIVELDSIRSRDQRYRKVEQFDSQKKTILDSINQVKFVEIINNYGYPNREIVGLKHESYLFFVLQHSNLEMMEKYLPLIKENIENGDLNKIYFAYLIDRINMLKGEAQVYGTQSTVNEKGESNLYKVLDIDNLNKRRRSFNLKPLDIPDN